MFESRCGVGCNSCERKEAVHCQGCLLMDAPFWGGECAIKACCEGKALDHCGVCPDFPCDLGTAVWEAVPEYRHNLEVLRSR